MRSVMNRLAELSTHLQSQLNNADWATKREIVRRSLATKLSDLSLEQTVRPKPLFRHALAWAHVFVTLSEDDDRRLEPGPFDAELTEVVALIEAEQPHEGE